MTTKLILEINGHKIPFYHAPEHDGYIFSLVYGTVKFFRVYHIKKGSYILINKKRVYIMLRGE